ncbi:MAG: hypothetical protein IJH76_00415 [Clostridia bacterium]|nr:hypothetical protein [Clostridia bacterium]
MTDVEYRNSLYELSEIFKILDKSLIAKIPQGLKDIIAKEKSTNYNFKLDYSKKLSEQKLSETTELFLTTLHLKYWCNEEEKQQILNAMRENENKYQEELREQYNPDNLFKNKYNSVENNNIKEQSTTQQMQMIEYQEESILKRIINKIKSLFKK